MKKKQISRKNYNLGFYNQKIMDMSSNGFTQKYDLNLYEKYEATQIFHNIYNNDTYTREKQSKSIQQIQNGIHSRMKKKWINVKKVWDMIPI